LTIPFLSAIFTPIGHLKSIEEAAESVGATKSRTFRDMVAPLIWKGIRIGALYSFILTLREASATLLLVIAGREIMPAGIFNSTSAGR